MSFRVRYSGKIDALEITTTAASVTLPPFKTKVWLQHLGPQIAANIDLEPGDHLPYRLALLSVLRDAWLNNREVETYVVLGAVLQTIPGSTPIPMPIPDHDLQLDDPNFPADFPYTFGPYLFLWYCESVIVSTG